MLKFVPLLIIPIIFTFTFDHYFFDQKDTSNIKKDFIKKISSAETIPRNSTINSSTIIQFYSEKIIQNFEDENIVMLKPKRKKIQLQINKKNLVPKITELDKSLKYISSDWQNNFSNKKVEFIKTLLPLIAFENQTILAERKKLLDISNFLSLEKTLSENDLNYLNKISLKYKISSKNKHKIDLINQLLLSVNIIPNSIVLAQAANESGWGTSRFAREYNALFGQYTYDENSGVIPSQREKGKKHLIKNFKSINKSVESYFNNINSHHAYKNFRKLRSQIDNFDNDYNIKILTNALDVYAEDESYVETINKIIDTNNLNQFDIISKGLISS